MERDVTTPGEPGHRNEQVRKQIAVEEVEPVDDTEQYAILGED
ncbi:hypothetical protein [Kitasatospora sp. GAS204B]|nr:hypothetical protein [Kitasatospora sp. GAS204B]MDH6117799.1 hypothetical protein [Kitasatospora sp. GAS204B]